MARANPRVIHVLRNTLARLQQSSAYQWGHMGSCNCGFLAQEISRLDKREIHARAMQRSGDWNEQLKVYCPTSGLPMDELISSMLCEGFTREDLVHLERLSDPEIVELIPAGDRL
jgi:hypothetical protein